MIGRKFSNAFHSRGASPALRTVLASTALLLTLAACTPRQASGERVRAELGSPADVAQASQYWSARFERSPGDEKAAYAYSRALAAQDQRAQAVAVLQKAVLANASSKFLKGELGKALAANGQFSEALNVLAQAHTPDQPDWRLLSAQGAIYDQLGRPDEARQQYFSALRIAPGETSVLSNLGLSYALAGDLTTAETYMRQATAGGKGEAKTRQNLAIIVGLQGRFTEAEEIARRDLPVEQAEKNIALLRSMLAQANTWDAIRNGGKTPAPSAQANAARQTSAGDSKTQPGSATAPKENTAPPAPARTATAPINLLQP